MPYADPARKRASDAAYKAVRREFLAAKQRAYYQANRPAEDSRHRAYLEARPELRRAITFANRSNQRAARAGSLGKLLGAEVVLVVGPCAYCGSDTGGWDHVMPLSKRGVNTVGNLVPCCTACNRRKHARIVEALR